MTRTPDYQRAGVSLYLGDCLEIMPTLKDGSVDFVFCDPPYGHSNNNNDLIHRWEVALGRKKKLSQKAARPIANDGDEANDLIQACFLEWHRLLSPGCCCCCCAGGGGPDPQFARWSLWLDNVFDFKQMVVWDKGPMGMGWHYRRSYETVLVGQKPGDACRWFSESSSVENVIRPGAYGIRKIIPTADQHPTEKPVELAQHFIGLHTEPRHLVMDSCFGSGSAAIACIRTGRRFVGMEIDPRFFKMAVNRIEAEFARHPMFAEEEATTT